VTPCGTNDDKRRAVPLPLPIEAMALDNGAAAMMMQWYGEPERRRLRFGPEVPITTRASA
jgi:hypothetical protein